MALQSNKVCFFLLLIFSYVGGCVFATCSVTQCTDPSKCLLAPDRRSCKCASGLYGSLCDKVVPLSVLCGKDFMTIMAPEDFFTYNGVELQDLRLANESCRAQREYISGTSYYVVRTSKEDYLKCGGKPLEKNQTHVTYSLTLTSTPKTNGKIVRNTAVKIDYKCVYPYSHSVSFPWPFIALSSDLVVHVNQLDATITMSLYTDETYTKAFTSSPLLRLKEMVYVELKVTEPQEVFDLRVNECWATQSANASDADVNMHALLRDGCAEDETVQFLNGTSPQDGVNGQGSVVRFSFKMFRFLVTHQFFLHCTVQLCVMDYNETCVPECRSMKKRDTSEESPVRGQLTYGPIRLQVPETKSNTVMMLALPIVGIWVLGVLLLILIAVARAGNRPLFRPSNR